MSYPTPPRSNTGRIIAIVAVTFAVIAALGVVAYRSEFGSTAHRGDPSRPAASADDISPVGIITDEPTCTEYTKAAARLKDPLAKVMTTDTIIKPPDEWTEQDRRDRDSVRAAYTEAIPVTAALSRQTPHRVVRELYEQFTAYARAYLDTFDKPRPHDGFPALTAGSFALTIANVCAAIDSGVAAKRAGIPVDVRPGHAVAPASDATKPAVFLPKSDKTCPEWVDVAGTVLGTMSSFEDNGESADGPLTQEQKRARVADDPAFRDAIAAVKRAGDLSGNATARDFGDLARVYLTAYLAGSPDYTTDDRDLSHAGASPLYAVAFSCEYLGD